MDPPWTILLSQWWPTIIAVFTIQRTSIRFVVDTHQSSCLVRGIPFMVTILMVPHLFSQEFHHRQKLIAAPVDMIKFIETLRLFFTTRAIVQCNRMVTDVTSAMRATTKDLIPPLCAWGKCCLYFQLRLLSQSRQAASQYDLRPFFRGAWLLRAFLDFRRLAERRRRFFWWGAVLSGFRPDL